MLHKPIYWLNPLKLTITPNCLWFLLFNFRMCCRFLDIASMRYWANSSTSCRYYILDAELLLFMRWSILPCRIKLQHTNVLSIFTVVCVDKDHKPKAWQCPDGANVLGKVVFIVLCSVKGTDKMSLLNFKTTVDVQHQLSF